MEEKCEACAFWLRNNYANKTYGVCRFNPPANNTEVCNDFPCVQDDQWCGKFQWGIEVVEKEHPVVDTP